MEAPHPVRLRDLGTFCFASNSAAANGISGLVVEYIVAIDVTRVRFPADALGLFYVALTGIFMPANPLG